MQIKCPECQALLSLGKPKPGSFRPKCKKCGKAFRLKVTDEDPPRVAVGKLRVDQATAKAPKPKSAQAAKTPAAAAASATSAKRVVHAKQGPSSDQGASQPVEVDRTIANQVDTTQNDATLDGAAFASEQSTRQGTGSVRRGGQSADNAAGRTAGDREATINGTVESRPAADSSAPSPQPAAGKAAADVPAKPKRKKAVAKSAGADEIPERLGGYRIVRLLGRGAMGAVYEAKQLSLDRLVALKTIRSRLSKNPSSLARFTREAYAAAQLTHHNIVQIYDFGEDMQKHFFSMEWVRGGPLDELIKEKGALDPRLAAGYALQAARGLQYAHRNGMVHRDIKPANLLLSGEGVIKVADLGLVKVPDQTDAEASVSGAPSDSGSGTQMTMQGTAVGTPAYMAPEQAIDAASVDHRADIYSLGCTLFYMLAGRAPFDGSDASEVMDQHAHQALPNLVQLNPRVPEELKDIVERAMAKRPSDRYPALPEMIAELEAFLGLSSEGDFSPSVEQADEWEKIAVSFAAMTKKLRLTRPIMTGLVGFSGFAILAMPMLVGFSWILFGPALLIAAITAALAFGAPGGGSPVVTNFRAWITSLPWTDYVIGFFGGIIFLLVAMIIGMSPGLIVGGLLGAAAGVAYHFLIVVPSRKASEPVIKDAERFIRNLRIDGADEDGVRSFAARYGGKHWRELFEAVFGYEALCKIREQLHGDRSFSGPTSEQLRDKLCSRLADKSKANREARDHKRLAKLEERGLQSEGLSAAEARETAWQMAAVVIDEAKAPPPTAADPTAQAEAKRNRMKSMMADARSGKYKRKRDLLAPIRFLLGGQTRLLAGCVLLGVFAVWGNNNGMFDSLKNIDLQNITQGEIDTETLKRDAEVASSSAGRTAIAGANAWSIGIAGLLLTMSAFVSGWRMTPFAIAATAVILFGPKFGIPSLTIPVVDKTLQPWMLAGVAGIVCYVPGIFFGEKRR